MEQWPHDLHLPGIIRITPGPPSDATTAFAMPTSPSARGYMSTFGVYRRRGGPHQRTAADLHVPPRSTSAWHHSTRYMRIGRLGAKGFQSIILSNRSASPHHTRHAHACVHAPAAVRARCSAFCRSAVLSRLRGSNSWQWWITSRSGGGMLGGKSGRRFSTKMRAESCAMFTQSA